MKRSFKRIILYLTVKHRLEENVVMVLVIAVVVVVIVITIISIVRSKKKRVNYD